MEATPFLCHTRLDSRSFLPRRPVSLPDPLLDKQTLDSFEPDPSVQFGSIVVTATFSLHEYVVCLVLKRWPAALKLDPAFGKHVVDVGVQGTAA